MKEFIGKECDVIVQIRNETLVFSCKVREVDDVHIGFIDKFDTYYVFRRDQVIEIKEKS